MCLLRPHRAPERPCDYEAFVREAARICNVPLTGWIVGDSAESDIVGGTNAGLKTIWMARRRKWTSRHATPDHIVDSILSSTIERDGGDEPAIR